MTRTLSALRSWLDSGHGPVVERVTLPAREPEPQRVGSRWCQVAGCRRPAMGGYTRWCEWHRPGIARVGR
jgi:hypothetical protein